VSESFDYDVLIVGGGLVGASLACSLRDSGLRVAVLEAHPLRADDQPSFDARTVALSYGSRRIFAAMGLWQAIEDEGVEPIRRIHVSDRGHLGVTRLDCRDQHVEALGYVAESRVLGKALAAGLATVENLELLCPASLESLDFHADHVGVRYVRDGQSEQLTTRLVVAADGGNSTVRRLTGVKAWEVGYGQTAVIANVVTERPHQQVAYERFTDTGPMALLPTRAPAGAEGRCAALVWTVRDAQREEIMGLDEETFLARLGQRFGRRVGAFERVSRRHAYPLTLLRVREHVRSRLAVIGNAAHTLHPVAGQGFNLGLRDVAVLAQVLVDGTRAGRDPGELELLNEYMRWRRRDQLQTAVFTDGLVRLFSTGLTPIAALRNAGLVAVDLLPPAKKLLARHAMGLLGHLPRLARGLPL